MAISFSEYRSRAHQTKAARMLHDKLYFIDRSISVRLSYSLLRIFPNLSPNAISIFNIILILMVLGLDGLKQVPNVWLISLFQLILLRLSAIIDRMDGEVARFKEFFSQTGLYYDQIFHLFYSFVFVFSFGYSFFVVSSSRIFLIAVVAAALLMVSFRLLGKLRHHIRHKIRLEHHEELLRDYRSESGFSRAKNSSTRYFGYLLFFIYDWSWGGYLLIAICANFCRGVFWLYALYLLVLIIVLLYQLLIVYPRHSLFSEKELTD